LRGTSAAVSALTGTCFSSCGHQGNFNAYRCARHFSGRLILYLVNLLPLDGRAKQIVRVVVIILGVISLLKYIAVF
jgi:hypothetical protein